VSPLAVALQFRLGDVGDQLAPRAHALGKLRSAQAAYPSIWSGEFSAFKIERVLAQQNGTVALRIQPAEAIIRAVSGTNQGILKAFHRMRVMIARNRTY
jgi:hypothetical protein